MHRFRRAVPRLALALAALTPARACAPPHPACAVVAVPGKPVLCVPRDGVGLFVVGLAAGHGWDRGDWVMLELPRERADPPVSVPVAMAVVVERYADLARVQVLYQREAMALDGAAARKIAKDDRARLGKFVGRIAQIDLARVRIDVGEQDRGGGGGRVPGAVAEGPPGDRAGAGDGGGGAVGVGVALDKREAFEPGLDAVWLKDATGDERMPVSIVVANFLMLTMRRTRMR